MRKLQPILNPRIGDLVFNPSLGNGFVDAMLKRECILVKFECGINVGFTRDGKNANVGCDIIALFQGHVKFPYDISVDEIEQVTRKG